MVAVKNQLFQHVKPMIIFLNILTIPCVIARFSYPGRYPKTRDYVALAKKFHAYNRVTTDPAPPELIKQINDHASYAAVAYCDEKQLLESNRNTRSLGLGITVVHSISDEDMDTHSLLLVNILTKEIVLSFRGSDSPKKFLFAASQETVGYPLVEGAVVQKNVLHSIEDIQSAILVELRFARAAWNDFQIVIVGHSLGGSLATIMAPVVAKELGIPPKEIRVITYNQPRVGNKAFAVHYNSLGFNFTRVTNKDDPVHNYPSKEDGWYHVHREVYINEDDNFFICGTDKLEDPKCSYHTKNKLAILYNHEWIGKTKISPRGCGFWDFI